MFGRNRIWGLGLLSLALAGCGGPNNKGVTPTPPPAPTPEPTLSDHCRLWFAEQKTGLRGCGDISVPLRYAEPQGKKIALNYVLFAGSAPQKSRDVTVMIQGGPGMSAMPLVEQTRQLMSKLRPQSDLLIFEQRGIGVNTPSLACDILPGIASVQPQKLSADAAACLRRYQAEGLNLADFNTRANADDIGSLIRGLGYEKANLYGMSYGTRVAQEVVRRHPELVRSVVLDGVLDPAESWALRQTRYMQETLLRFGQACASAGRCADPNLPARVQRVADLIDHQRLTFVPLNSSEPAPLTGDVFLSQVHALSYSTGGLFYLLDLLDRLEAREPQAAQEVAEGAQNLWQGLNMGAFFAYACQDNAVDENGIDAAHASLLPVFQARGKLYRNLASLCREAGLNAAPDALAPVSGNVPTLLLSGRYDAITPPELAERVARRFSGSQHVIFEQGGHVNGISSLCGLNLMLNFIETLGPVDGTCATQSNLYGSARIK